MSRMVRFNRIISMSLIIMLLAAHVCPAFASTVKATVTSSSANLYEKASSSSSHVDISKGATVTVGAVKDGWAKVKYKGVVGYMRTSSLSKSQSTTKTRKSWKARVTAMKWYDGGSSTFDKGEYATLYDINTGTSIRIKRMGGHNHADVEPATKKDAAKLHRFGYSWDARAGILKVDDKYIACAFNTKPHGDETISNNGFEGQFCLHMLGSKTHGTGNVNGDMQKAISRAYAWAH